MRKSPFRRHLAWLERLDEAQIPYTLRHSRSDALMVVAFAPGEYWEIDFLEDGEVEVERYRSNGHLADDSVLEQLFSLWAEPETAPEGTVSDDAHVA